MDNTHRSNVSSPATAPSTTSTPLTVPDQSGPEWPFQARKVTGRFFTLAPLEASHTDQLWALLGDAENSRLFRQVYLRTCKDLASFKTIMREHMNSSFGNVTYTVISSETGRPFGWILIHSFTTRSHTTPKGVECALFLPEHQRTEAVFASMRPALDVFFEELGYDQVDFRRGSHVQGSAHAGEAMGHSLVGILRRQMLVKDKSQQTDLYRLTKELFPNVRIAVDGWLDSHPIEVGDGGGGK